jgi:16S rRNA C967 or C1407 C5-methylase (RsmB/RsmF family)
MKKTARNEVTGDWLQSKPNNEMFEQGWDRIFGKKEKPTAVEILAKSVEANKELLQKLAEYELNPSTGEVQKVDNGDTTNTQE